MNPQPIGSAESEPANQNRWFAGARRTSPQTPLVTENTVQSGWIEWKGGDCPIPGHIEIQIRQRRGIETRAPQRADVFDWCHREIHPKYDIIAYRIVEDTMQTPNWSKPAADPKAEAVETCKRILGQPPWGVMKYYDQHGEVPRPSSLSAESIDQIRSILKDLLDEQRREIYASYGVTLQPIYDCLKATHEERLAQHAELIEQLKLGHKRMTEMVEEILAKHAAGNPAAEQNQSLSQGESISRAKDQTFKPRPFNEKY